jgi:hypothetical protein
MCREGTREECAGEDGEKEQGSSKERRNGSSRLRRIRCRGCDVCLKEGGKCKGRSEHLQPRPTRTTRAPKHLGRPIKRRAATLPASSLVFRRAQTIRTSSNELVPEAPREISQQGQDDICQNRKGETDKVGLCCIARMTRARTITLLEGEAADDASGNSWKLLQTDPGGKAREESEVRERSTCRGT